MHRSIHTFTYKPNTHTLVQIHTHTYLCPCTQPDTYILVCNEHSPTHACTRVHTPTCVTYIHTDTYTLWELLRGTVISVWGHHGHSWYCLISSYLSASLLNVLHALSYNVYTWGSASSVPIEQISKPRHKEVKYIFQSHTAHDCWSGNYHCGCLIPIPMFLSSMPWYSEVVLGKDLACYKKESSQIH